MFNIKQEKRRINSSVTVLLHVRKGEWAGLEPFLALKSIPSRCFARRQRFFLHPSLSRNLTVKTVITESRSRYRWASLRLSKSFLAGAHLARSASCVVSDVPTTAIYADRPRVCANKQQHRCSVASRSRDGVIPIIPRQPRAPRGLDVHTLKNVAARSAVACGPEASCCSAAASYLN